MTKFVIPWREWRLKHRIKKLHRLSDQSGVTKLVHELEKVRMRGKRK